MFPPLASFSSWKLTKSCKCNSAVAGGGWELQLVFCLLFVFDSSECKILPGLVKCEICNSSLEESLGQDHRQTLRECEDVRGVRQLHLTDSLCTFLVAAKYRATRLRLSYNLEILLQSFWSYICLIARLPLTASGWNSASGRYQEINSRGSL